MRTVIIGLVLWIGGFGYTLGAEMAGVRVETLAKSSAAWNDTPLPNYPCAASPEITLLKLQIAPGARLPMHQHPVINAAFILKGELTVHAESGAIRRLKAGDALIELVEQWHYGDNSGSEPVELVVFYAGTAGQKLSVLKDP